MLLRRPLSSRTLILFVALAALSFRALAAEPARLPPAPDDSFSIVVIPDTQEYRGRGTKASPESTERVTNPAFEAHVRWIVDNLQSQRIVFVSHVGDIVDINVPDQWEVARQCMDRMHGRVAYAISPGNHDMKPDGDSSLFQEFFPASRFAEFAWYGGTYGGSGPGISGNNANSFQQFSAGGMDFLFLHLECNAPDDVLGWADEVLSANPERRAIVTTHMGLGPLRQPVMPQDFQDAPKGRMQWKKRHGTRGNTPQEMWDKCFRKHANLFLIFSGDQSRTQALWQLCQNDHGKPVYEVLSDYHENWLRVNRFLPQLDRIEVYTIDSRDGTLCEKTRFQGDPRQHQFTLDCEMSPVAEPARRE